MSVLAKCPNCDGEVAVGLFTQIRVDALDDDGNPMLDKTGARVKVVLNLPKHVLPKELRSTPLITAADRKRMAEEQAGQA